MLELNTAASEKHLSLQIGSAEFAVARREASAIADSAAKGNCLQPKAMLKSVPADTAEIGFAYLEGSP